MRGQLRRHFLGFLISISVGGILHAQPSSAPLPSNYLRQLIHDSGMIFAGTVLQVQTANSTAGSSIPVSRVTFRVEEAVRGVHRGQILNVSEWGGLWQSGEQYKWEGNTPESKSH